MRSEALYTSRITDIVSIHDHDALKQVTATDVDERAGYEQTPTAPSLRPDELPYSFARPPGAPDGEGDCSPPGPAWRRSRSRGYLAAAQPHAGAAGSSPSARP
eukprot:scaffold808_cov370-Prasinococcus_capsulatus_cf.AAC.15